MRPRRASALPADERRAAIVRATVPLVLERGAAVTTRHIAAAAGIAEGTIFRVFEDKEAVLDAVLEAVFDVAPLDVALAEIDTDAPFEQRLEAAVKVLQQRMIDIWRVVTGIGLRKNDADRGELIRRRSRDEIRSLAALFERERDQLRFEPVVAAQLLRNLVVASGHPSLATEAQLSAADIVSVLLDGVRRDKGDRPAAEAAELVSGLPDGVRGRPC